MASVKTVTVGGTEYLLTHVATPRINGGKCNQYEVSEERRNALGEDYYHQYGDVYVPFGRSVQEHMEWWSDEANTRSFAEWSKDRWRDVLDDLDAA